MSDTADLVKRLRYWEGDGHPHGLLHAEAASELQSLSDRIAVLEGALKPFAECQLDYSWQPGEGGSRIHLKNLIPPAKKEFDAARASLIKEGENAK